MKNWKKAGAVGFLILTGTPLDKDEDRLPDYRTLRGVKKSETAVRRHSLS